MNRRYLTLLDRYLFINYYLDEHERSQTCARAPIQSEKYQSPQEDFLSIELNNKYQFQRFKKLR